MHRIILSKIKLVIFLLFGFYCFLPAVQAVEIEKAFLYDKHTLSDSYPYKQTTRQFQWDKINNYLTLIDTMQSVPVTWAVLQNYKNVNERPPLVKNSTISDYNTAADAFDVERSQSIPLYAPNDLTTPERYSQDGSLVKIISEDGNFFKIKHSYFASEWLVPKKYVQTLNANTIFSKVIFIDRTNQNISTLEKVATKWLVRSMNPTTTGLHRPPHMRETPLGIFMIQAKANRMPYYIDGTTQIGGSAPFASRFSGGGYLHGIPIDLPRTQDVEFSAVLGTTPRSHKCVRNATSHAKFIYTWAPIDETLVFVFD